MKEAEIQKKRQEATDKAELQYQRYLNDLENVIKTGAGKRVMIHLLERAGIMSQVMVPSEPDRSYFNEGRRLFGLKLLQDLAQADPENFTMPVMKYKQD